MRTGVGSDLRATTILAVRRDDRISLGGDGQVTLGSTIVKAQSSKVRRIHDGKVLVGFAGSAADAMALVEKLEARLEEYRGSLRRAAVELAKDWRSDRALRRLDAQVIACDEKESLLVSGTGDVIAPDDGVLSIGSGAPSALAAARALVTHTTLPPEEIVREALRITSEICVYTNGNLTIESIPE
ncbi:ATP-dependent protease subunit HslV [Candidatus Poribacteria bacterium]|nr:ATP-dependent protease subunit HslV [Candidatus Poribacteria bacterium]